ncbi:MAG: hypothetical protein M0009_09960 [Deltaproteobacteria bacterium]|nr:hypothetical protein [Deltaproteobacteria bacterium]
MAVQKQELQVLLQANEMLREIDSVNQRIEKLRRENQQIAARTKADTTNLDQSLKEAIALSQKTFAEQQKLRQVTGKTGR